MPLVDSAQVSPYPTIATVMNLARVRVDDTAIDLDGELLANDQPYAETLLNSAWSWFQDKCATSGIERPIRTAIIYGLPIASDPSMLSRAWINWFGCSDGINQFETPTLPSDLYLPSKVSIRQSGCALPFQEMRQAQGGCLPDYFDGLVYDWSDDGLYYYPQSYTQDMQIRYSANLQSLSLADVTASIPYLGCERTLAARMAFEFCNMRGAAQAPAMQQLAEDEFEMIAQRTGRKNQRRNIRRQPYARANRYLGW